MPSIATRCLIFSSIFLTAAPHAFAQESDLSDGDTPVVREQVFEGWTGSATLGANTSTGSAETSSVNGSLRVGKRSGKWENWFNASAFKGESAVVAPRRGLDGEILLGEDGEPIYDIVRGDTSDRLAAAWQPRYYFGNQTYGFLNFDWEQDEPTGVKVATRQIAGVGMTFNQDQSGYFSIELGAGNKNLTKVSGEKINGAIGFVSANYLYRINPNVTFNANLTSDFGGDTRGLETGLGIAFKLTETLAFSIAHFVRSNSEISNESNPLSGRRDSVTTMNLVIDI